MSVSFWMNEIYENRHENEMVREFCGLMREAFERVDVPVHVVLNFKLPAVDREGLPRGYLLSPDAMVVRPDGFLLIDFKHYSVPVTGHLNAYSCPWTADTPREGVVEVHGGAGKRTPLGQLRDYRRALIRVLMPWLDEYGICASPEKMVFGAAVFSNAPLAADNAIDLQGSSSAWCSAVRLRAVPHVAEGVCGLVAMLASGRHRVPDARDLPSMIERLFRGRPAVLVGGMPMPSVPGAAVPSAGAAAEGLLAGYPEVCRAVAKALHFEGRPRLRSVDAAADPSNGLVQICRPRRARLFVWQDTPPLAAPVLDALRRRFPEAGLTQVQSDRVLYTYWSEGEPLLPCRLTAVLATLPEALKAAGGAKMRMMALADRLQPAAEAICREVSPDVRIVRMSQRINWLCAERKLPEGMRRELLRICASPYKEAGFFREEQLPAALKAACGFLEAFGGTLPAGLAAELAKVEYPPEPTRSAAERYPSLRVIFRGADPVRRRYRVSEWLPGAGGGDTFWVELHNPAKVKEDESYLLRRGRLREGDVLSLVTPYRPKDRPDTVIASATVLEPDFLFSPSKLGAVVRHGDYAGAVRFLKRFDVFSPLATAHMMRGNVANTMLTELLMHPETPPDGPAVSARYRRRHCEEELRAGDRLPQAIDDERLTRIAAQLSERLGIPNGAAGDAALGGVPTEDWLQEVPFVSPELGFQGRMDLFAPEGATHPATVVELKASKPLGGRDGLYARPEHAFQPQLYSELLFHTLRTARDLTRALVLYAGEKPLMKQETGSADGLRAAMRQRNMDFLFLRNICEGRLEQMLEHIRVSDLRGRISEEEWCRFGYEDRMSALLKLLMPEDRTVRAYLHTAVRFLCQEEMLAYLGSGGHGDLADTWLLPFDERARSGMLLDGLREDPSARVTLPEAVGMMSSTAFVWERGGGDCNAGANFRDGDAVWMYRRSSDAGMNRIDRALLTAGTVLRIEAGRVTVAFDMPQRVSLCGGALWVAEHAPIVGGSSGCWRGLREFLTGAPSRRELLLGRAPLTSAVSAEELRTLDARADGPLEAVAEAVRKTDDLFLLWGPPGTGKTSHAIRRFLLDALAEGESVLMLAYTNKAVDNLCELLDRLRAEGAAEGGLSYFRIASASYQGAYRDRCLANMPFRSAGEARAELEAARVVVGTVSSVQPDHPVFGVKRFSLALVDEAAQLLEPQILAMFCAADREEPDRPLVRRWVFIGDHCQLPAVVQQPGELARLPEDSPLNACGIRDCRESFFARMWRVYRDDPRFCGRLRTQYRMHPDIAAFVSRFAYGGGLHNGRPAVAEVPQSLRDDRYVAQLAALRLSFCHAPRSPECAPKSSRTEAEHVAGFVRALCAGFGLAPEEIGVIVAFRNQIAMVRSVIAEQGVLTPEALDRVEIDTVERFQGSEKRAVLYTVAASTEGHLAFLRDACRDVPPEGAVSGDGPVAVDCKLNVAVTRAREWFVLIGDRTLLTRVDSYRRLIEWCDASVCG